MSGSTLIRVVDVETTGIHETAEVCEVGYSDVIVRGNVATPPDRYWSHLCGITTPMNPEAQGVHHISPRDLEGQPALDDVWPRVRPGAEVFCAHNAKFEERFLDTGPTPWLCTLKAARRLYGQAPSHGNQTLRYWFGVDLPKDRCEPAHRAGPDTYVTAHLLAHMINQGASVEKMIEWTSKPSLLPICSMTKHKGKTWEQVTRDDPGYTWWICHKATDMDEDTLYTARYWRRVLGVSGK